jgi:hypothetical protein
MTSDDTHARTQKLLEENRYFGMDKDQVTLIKQVRRASVLLQNVCCTATFIYRKVDKLVTNCSEAFG